MKLAPEAAPRKRRSPLAEAMTSNAGEFAEVLTPKGICVLVCIISRGE